MAKKTRRNVPIVNRAEQESGITIKVPRVRLGYKPLVLVIVVVIIVLVMITVPLRNYMGQRAELARRTASINALNNQKALLESEIKKYQSEEYIKEQARIRLGVIEPGEVAYRVIDPALENQRQTGDSAAAMEDGLGSWYEVLWNSVTVPDTLEETEETPTPTGKLPIAPDPNSPTASEPADPAAP
jgi:hypothetical protein